MDTYISDGSTASYYVLPEGAKELQDLISHKDMNAQIGEIFRACYRYGGCRHSGRLRDAKKILFYAQAEVKRLEASLSLDDAHLNKILDAFAEQGEEEPPVPWGYAPHSVRYITRDADGAIDAWEEDRPVLAHGAVWCGSGVELIRLLPGDGGEHEPKIWERPARADDEEPPVPWDEVPDAFKYIRRDADGTIEAWTDRQLVGLFARLQAGWASKCLGQRHGYKAKEETE